MKHSQHPEELADFLALVKGAKSVLEIGSRYGETLIAMSDVLHPGARIVSVELPEGPWGRSNSLMALQGVINTLNEKGFDATLIVGDSTDHEVIDQVGTETFDVVFIDGDHRYEGVMTDYENYGQLGKLVAFHDVCAEEKKIPTGQVMGVPKAWREIIASEERAHLVIYHDSGMGIGVLIHAR